jgi:ketosteroid isomerase-like protein
MQVLRGGPAPVWLEALFGAIDASDAEGFVGYLTEDAVFCFGNAPPMRGRAAIEQGVRQFFATIGQSRHRIARVWAAPEAVALDGLVTYTRLDGSEVTLPFADTLVLRGERVAEYFIYVDVAPLFAQNR